MKNYAKLLRDSAPIIGFFIVTIFFAITTGGRLLSFDNIQNLTGQVIVTALVAIGAVFVFGSGNLDMSLGACVNMSAVLGCMAAIATGSMLAAFVVCMLTSLAFALFKGLFAAFVDVPLFIVTIVMGTAILALVRLIMGSKSSITLDDAVTTIPKLTFDEKTWINISILGAFFILCLILFKFTGLGRKIKILGGSAIVAKQTGLNIKAIKIAAFMVGSIGVGLAAFVLMIRTRTIENTAAGSVGIDVMVALVLGGMPLSGGSRSMISAGLIGALTITVLNSGLSIMGISTDLIQIVRGVVFLAIVLVASYTYRTELLPR